MRDAEKELLRRKAIGEKLRELRGKKTIYEVAKALGVTPAAVSNWELGVRTPNDYMKVKIAEYYDTTVEKIFFTTEVLI